MKKNNQIKHKLAAIVFAGGVSTLALTTAGVMLTSCGGGNTPTSDRTNKISFKQTQAIINYGDSFSIDMTLEKELASGQKITGYVSSCSGNTGGQALAVQSITTTGTTAKVTFKYGIAPFTDKGVDTFTVKFTGSTNDKTEWTNSVENIKVTFSK